MKGAGDEEVQRLAAFAESWQQATMAIQTRPVDEACEWSVGIPAAAFRRTFS
jgi:hypothetical protein